ncbi:MAG: phage Gp37/Gp68 family protein [bacterium]|nr:phage Gp37/Gp68 family protein [bacterium]
MPTKIEWTEEAWNPTVGCEKCSPGCKNCYAIREARRLAYNPDPVISDLYRDVVTPKGQPLKWTGKITLAPERLQAPLHWRKPRTVFVNSMSDLFHESLPDKVIDEVFAVMALCPQHTFQVLTKRAEQMYKRHWTRDTHNQIELAADRLRPGQGHPSFGGKHSLPSLPFSNIHLGVSVENRATLDRIDWLRKTPAAIRFLSLEPLLEDLGTLNFEGIDWVIVGGESGPGARPCNVSWIRQVVRQCKETGLPVFVKQLGAKPFDVPRYRQTSRWPDEVEWKNATEPILSSKGSDMSEWPKDLHVRQMPEVQRA